MRSILVIGNETLGSSALEAELARRIAQGPCQFHVVVPASPPREQPFWTEGEAVAHAHDRLDTFLLRMSARGADITGEVGDPSAVLAVEDALRRDHYDEIILSTLPPGVSRWLRQDLPHRLSRHTDLPVHHIVANPATVGAR
jgi:hypothetical protein